MPTTTKINPRTKTAAIGIAGCLGVLFLMIVGIVWFARTATDNYAAGAKMKEVSYAIDQFALDNDGKLPTLSDRSVMEKQIEGYGSERRLSEQRPILASPGTNKPYVLNASVSDQKISSLKGKEPFLILYDQRQRLGKYEAAVYDGNNVFVHGLSEQELAALKRRSGMP